MTQFTSHQHNVTEEQLSTYFDGFINEVEHLTLWDISITPSGHGHYKIIAKFEFDNEEIEIKEATSNMQLIDAWKSGMIDDYNDGEDGFDNWNEVVSHVLSVIDPEEQINEFKILN